MNYKKKFGCKVFTLLLYVCDYFISPRIQNVLSFIKDLVIYLEVLCSLN